MKRKFLVAVVAMAFAAGAMALPSAFAGQAPIMGGGYNNVVAIPVDDPAAKAISGALFKPDGQGPFPAVIYMGTCADIDSAEERFMQMAVRERLLPKGFAVMIVDPYWPREEWQGVCSEPNAGGDYGARSARDIHAAMDVLKTAPEIDANRIFVYGVGLGASAALSAIDAGTPPHQTKLAGAIAISPHCSLDAAPSAPALILIGDKDLWAPAERCKVLARMPNVQLKVYPGVGHAFAMPFGHRAQHNLDAANDAQRLAEAFMAAHMK